MNTLDPEFFKANILSGEEQRKLHHSDRDAEEFEIDPGIFDIIVNSCQIVHSRGKALGYFSAESKRKDKEDQPRVERKKPV